MNTVELCKKLDWDTQHFDFNVARVQATRLTLKTCASIEAWCTQHAIRCLYFLADADDPVTVELAEEYGYHFVDIRITYGHDIATLPPRPGSNSALTVRPATETDIPALRALSHYPHSRFFFDTRFSQARATALYETWIEKSCRGGADIVWVADDGESPVGYISCQLADDGVGSIGLVGVAARAQRRGAGSRLVATALYWLADHGAVRVEVVTQGRNVAAQRLYQRQGFVIRSLRLWYHRWFDVAVSV